MKARLVNLGVFATLLDVYSRFPQGGVEGDYVIVDGKELLWDKHRLRWGDGPRNDVTKLHPDPSPYPGIPGGGVSSIELARLRSEVESLRDRVGKPDGIAPLDPDGLLPAKHLPPEANIEHRIRTELNDSISPLTARVLRLLQGDPSLQWIFVESATSTRRVEHVVRYSNTYKRLSVPAGVIRHLTMGIEGVRPDRPLSDYKTWDVPGIEVDVDDAVRNLYVYARCSKTDNTGTFVTSDGFKPMEGEEGYYHLLVGMLSSLPNRVFTPLYGLVEIPAAAIRIDKLISPDGEFVIDLVRKEIRGYKVSFTGGASGGPDADTILEGILGQARSYTDDKTDGLKSYVDTKSAGARNYTDSKHNEGKSYTDGKAGQAKSEAVAEAEKKDGEVRKYADEAANQATNKAKSYADEKVKDIEDNARQLDYLRKSITDGTTDIYGGLILTSFIGARDPMTNQVRSFFAGSSNTSLPAFAAGVTGFGTTGEKRVVEINHDGTGHWGQMEVMEGGKVLRIASMLFGGKLPDTYTHDFRTLESDDTRNERCRVYIGDEGALFFMGMWGASPRFVRISNKLNKPIVQIRGDIDIPGLLLSGRVNPRTMTLEYVWGAKKDSMRVERIGRGMYKIHHALGHTRYNVICNASGNGGHNASYVEHSPNYFTIRTNHDDGVYDDVWFSFIVVGDNY